MRITMGMISSQYKTRLNQSLQALSNANLRASNFRSFNQPSDDPFAAAQTYQVRRDTERNENYQSNLSNVQSSLKSAESTVRLVSNVVSNANSTDVLGAVNGTMTKDTRSAIVEKLRSMRDSILSDMNAKYSDQYLFGGAGSGTAPFSLDSSGNLLYRGVNVDTGVNTNGASAALTSTSTSKIDFGSSAKALSGYSLVIKSGSDPNTIDANTKTITVNLKSNAKNSDLQAALKNLSEWPKGVTADQISVDNSSDPVAFSQGGTATSISADASTVVTSNSSTQINFGKENGGKLDGYTIEIAADGSGTVSVSGKKITVNLADNAATKADLQNVLQDSSKWTGDSLPTGTDVTKITVSGDLKDVATVSNAGETAAITDKVNLDDLANEKVYVDLGFGLQFDDAGNILSQSAYNTALPGITFLGYGTDETTGIPNNVYSLMNKLSDLLDSDNVSMDTLQPYLDAFSSAENNLTTQISEIGAKETFLTSTQTHLEDVSSNLLSKDNDVEFLNPADAIMDWMNQQFCYQACLQMGTNILQPTLMDFLK